MAYGTLAHPQLAWPPFDSVEIETPGAFANSDWVPLESTPLGSDAVLTGVTLRPTFLTFFPGGSLGGQVEIGASVDDVVTPIATWPFINMNSFNAAEADNGLYLPTGFGIDLLPEGCLPMARIRSGQTGSDNTYRVSASYMQKPLAGGALLTTTSPQICVPDAATPVVVTTGASAWDDSVATTLRAASGPALVFTGVLLWSNIASIGTIELDLYADGDYVHTEQGSYNGKQGLPYYVPFRRPLDAFPEDALIEAVCRADFTTSPVYVAFTAHEKPL